MRIRDLLSRADDEMLQNLLGPSIMRLLLNLDPQSATSSKLQELLLMLRGSDGLLRDPRARYELFQLLRPAEASHLAQLLGAGKSTNPYQQLESAAISKGSKKEELMMTFFEVDITEPEVIVPSAEFTCLAPAYALFDHQRAAAKKVLAKLSTPPFRTILHMPTGSGKTRTAMNIVCDYLRQNEPTVVVWMVQGEELCEQAALEFEKAWRNTGNRQIDIHRFWGDRNFRRGELNDGLVVAGLSKLYSSLVSDQRIVIALGNAAKLVIVDEAHSAIADTYKMTLEALLVHNFGAKLLGLTATPGRTWNDIRADEELAQFFGRQKVTLEVTGYDSPIDYLVGEGYLAKANFRSLMHDGGLLLTDADRRAVQANFEIPDSILQSLADDDVRNLKIIESVEDLAKRHNRILVFAATVEHSVLIAAVLRARGIHARSITSKSTYVERARGIADFRGDSTDVMVLCNFGVLTTGFDAPRTSAALIARPTISLVLYSQMVGRAIRGSKAGGNAEAEIVTVIDAALPGFRSISESFLNWEDVWDK